MKADVIIVGQGLAGSLLAWQLLQRRLRVLVIDDGHSGSSSLVAAGLMNPVTGKRLLKSWNVERCLPAAVRCYRALEALLQRSLYHEKTILRLFTNHQQRQIWEQRCSQEEYQDYVDRLVISNDEVPCPLGGFYIRQAGYLNTRELLDGMKNVLRHRDSLIESHIRYEDIQINTQGVNWRDHSAKHLIFCEGHRISGNPWFNRLPLQPAQGEILTLTVAQPIPEKIINRGKWLLPIEPNIVKVGATFQWQPLDGVPTAEGKRELLKAYQQLWPVNGAFEVTGHDCGIRPGTRDKIPFIGMHPHYSQLGIFNGFGAKGSLWIPYYAEKFAHYLSGSGRLPEQTDIKRFAHFL